MTTKQKSLKNAQIFPDADKPLPKGKTLEGKLDDIYAFVNARDNHSNIDKGYFEKEFGAKEKNRGAFAYFTISAQPWLYYLSSM